MKRIGRILLVCGIAFPTMLPLLGQPAGQWNFDSGNLSATAGQPLQYSDVETETGTGFGTTTSFGIPDINGTSAQVMRFPAATNGMGYLMPTPAGPNGGGSLANEYTILLDVLYPQASDAKLRPLINTDGDIFVFGPDLVVSAGNGIGITPDGPFFGSLASNTWYRIGFVVVQEQNTVTAYVNGSRVGVNTITGSGQTGADGRFALLPGSSALILGSTSTNATAGYVNSIQLRDVALNSGQMNALGGPTAAGIPQTIPPIPSFIDTRTPDVNATGVLPTPNIQIVLHQGDTTINGSSIQLSFDGALAPATITPSVPTYTITYAVTNLLDPNSMHGLQLVYQDSVAGFKTNTWSFTVVAYQSIALPAPFIFENFDGVAETTLPAGWVVTNKTTVDHVGFNLADPESDSYLDWVVISTNTLFTAKGADPLIVPPIAVNGALLTAMANNQLAYAESDSRSGNQVQDLFSPDFDCTGKTNVYLSFHSIYQQNQDSLGAVEYSTDQGATWQPALYMLQCCIDGQDAVADIHRFPDGTIDAVTTLQTFVDGGAAWGTNYGFFIGAPITQALAPFISPRVNDDNRESIRVEVLRLAGADGQPKVRLRFLQTGTASWWFAIDNVGLYTINTPVIKTQPQSQTIDAGTPVTFGVEAQGNPPLSYQWKFNGTNIAGATTNTYTIANVSATNAGQYKVVVSNSDGPTLSNPAQLTVVTFPVLLSLPLSQVVDPNATVTFSGSARGGQPLSSRWLFNGTPISGATTNVYTLSGVQITNSGPYQLVFSNSYGAITTAVARLVVFSGSITQELVAHLKFDNNYDDSSGHNNNGTAVGAPGFAAGKIGAGALRYTSAREGSSFNYVTLGTPPDLNFGGTNDFSVSLWAKLTANSWVGDPPFVANKDWTSGGNTGWVLATDGDAHFQWNYREISPNARKDYDGPAGLFGDGNWHHLVVVYVRGGNALTYVDGTRVDTRSIVTATNLATTVDSGLPTNIGQDGKGTYTDGNNVGITNALADDVGIWRRALTPNEAASVYAQGLADQDLSTAGGAPSSLGQITVSASTTTLNFNWTGGVGIKLQKASSLTNPNWQDVSGSEGSSSASEPIGPGDAFYRLIKP